MGPRLSTHSIHMLDMLDMLDMLAFQLLLQQPLPQQLWPLTLPLLPSLPQQCQPHLSPANSTLRMSSETLLTAMPTSTLPSTSRAMDTWECLDLTAMLMPTVSSRRPTMLLMDLDSVSRPPTCPRPQSLRERLQSLRERLQSLTLLAQPRLRTLLRSRLPSLNSRLSLTRPLPVRRDPLQLLLKPLSH